MIGRGNMNKEDYVSLEVAKLLQKKGFREPCNSVYSMEYKDRYDLITYTVKNEYRWLTRIPSKKIQLQYLAPSLYEAQKWLRMKKRLHVEVNYMSGNYWIYETLTIPNHDLTGLSDRENVKYMSYEEALNAGIFEALKLI